VRPFDAERNFATARARRSCPGQRSRAVGRESSTFRLHGSPRNCKSIYDGDRLSQWALALTALPGSTPAWCVFDDTARGGAAANALQLQGILGATARKQ
jgi:uncharacterized protein YecE (DUF72 family)